MYSLYCSYACMIYVLYNSYIAWTHIYIMPSCPNGDILCCMNSVCHHGSLSL